MTELRADDAAFERALRATLVDLAPDTVPDTLRRAVATVPSRPGRASASLGRARLVMVGLAAALIVAVAAGIGMVAGPVGPLGQPSPAGSTPPAQPPGEQTTLTFRVVPADGSTASKAQVDAVGTVMAARLRAYGIETFSSSATDDRITFDMDVPTDPGSRTAIGSLLGTTGAFSIGQPVATPPDPGDTLQGVPLITGDDITDAGLGTDQTGNPTVDLTFSGPAATAFGDATTAHVGEYLPIALDRVVIEVPVIMAAITDGRVQLQLAGDDGAAPRLAAILQAGPLPLPVEAPTGP